MYQVIYGQCLIRRGLLIIHDIFLTGEAF